MPRNASGWCRPATANASATQKGARLGPFVFPNAAIRLKPARTPLRALRRIGHLSCSALTNTALRAPLGFLPPTQAYWRRLPKP